MALTEKDKEQVHFLLEDGLTIDEIIEETGISKTLIGYYYQRFHREISLNHVKGRRLSYKQLRYICILFKRGKTPKEIATRIKSSRSAVYYTLRNYAWDKAADTKDHIFRKQNNLKGRRKRNVWDRFWEKVDRSGYCWLWKGCTSYNRVLFFIKGHSANQGVRFLYENHYDVRLPKNTQVLHGCGNLLCVRPDHLKLRTLSKFNDEDWETVLELRKNEMPIRKIAEEFNCSEFKIWNYLKKTNNQHLKKSLDMTTELRGQILFLKSCGESLRAIAKQVRVSPWRVKDVLERNHLPETKATINSASGGAKEEITGDL